MEAEEAEEEAEEGGGSGGELCVAEPPPHGRTWRQGTPSLRIVQGSVTATGATTEATVFAAVRPHAAPRPSSQMSGGTGRHRYAWNTVSKAHVVVAPPQQFPRGSVADGMQSTVQGVLTHGEAGRRMLRQRSGRA